MLPLIIKPEGAHCNVPMRKRRNVGARCNVPLRVYHNERARRSVPLQGTHYSMSLHDKHHRRSTRLKGYDYSQPGAYFITICTYNKENIFGEVIDGDIHLNEFGKIVESEWLRTFDMRKNLKSDEYVIMPNHFHGIIIISDGRGTLQRAPTSEKFGKPVSNSIPTIIRLFKSVTTKQINQIRKTHGIGLWQRNYHEHVIRNEDELNQVREYIINNPLQWQFDRENPNCRVTLQCAHEENTQCAPTKIFNGLI